MLSTSPPKKYTLGADDGEAGTNTSLCDVPKFSEFCSILFYKITYMGVDHRRYKLHLLY